MVSSGMLRRVTLVRTDVSEKLSASFIRVTRIGELGTTLAVTSNRRMLLFCNDNIVMRSELSYADHCLKWSFLVQGHFLTAVEPSPLVMRPLLAYCTGSGSEWWIMMMMLIKMTVEQLVEWTIGKETEVLRANLPQRHSGVSPASEMYSFLTWENSCFSGQWS
jgi:hypothetical protein